MNAIVLRRALRVAAVVALLAIMEAAMLLSVRQESQTSDEAYSLFAGYVHLTAGDFTICPAYPPLTKDVAALPLLALRPRVPQMTGAEASDFRGGRIFLYANRADRLLFAARAAMTVFPLLLAALVFLCAWEMFGATPAFIALALIVFEPNILAHGPLVTNDVPLACCLFAAVYAFWRYVVNPNAWSLALCGLAAGLTLATKHSGIILFPILFLLACVEMGAGGEKKGVGDWGLGTGEDHAEPSTQHPAPNSAAGTPRNSRQLALRLLVALIATAVISVVVLWGFYSFRYRPVAEAPAPPLSPLLSAVRSRIASGAIAAAADVHLLPEAYLAGLAFFFATDSRPTYVLGKLYAHGVWFYFPTAFVIKSTLGFLLLLALALGARLWGARDRRQEALWMLVPAVVFLSASMTSNLNIGLRHILPVYPFLCVLAAAGVWTLARKQRGRQLVIVGMVLLHAASSLRAFPNYLPYSNELWGGPSKTYRVLTDSNVDWGQGLKAAKRYLATHAAAPCWLAYFGTVDPAYYDIPCTLLPVHTAVIWERPLGEIPPTLQGTVLVSATEMSGQTWWPGEINPYEQFRTAHPVDCVAGSILVYQGDFQVPLASALSRMRKVQTLESQGEFEAALTEARTAAQLAPESVEVQVILGRALKAAGRGEESQQAFASALRLAQTVHPESQTYWGPIIEGELGRR